MEEKVRTTEEEMNRKATLADVEAFGKEIGVSKTGCTYNKFIIALINMINVLYNHTLASSSVNLECLKILVGEPMYVMDELLKVKKAYDNEINRMSERVRKTDARMNKVEATSRNLRQAIVDSHKQEVMDKVILNGIMRDINGCVVEGDNSFRFIQSLQDNAENTHTQLYRVLDKYS